MRWGLALGTAGHMPSVLAAWLPNLVAGTGVALLEGTMTVSFTSNNCSDYEYRGLFIPRWNH